MKNMEKLQAGDILVFKADDKWISKTIAWITDSDVSHAAMMLDDGTIVEMGPNGISASKVETVDGDRTILLRLSPERDFAPLVRSAEKYLDSKTRYDFPALAFLAGLLIYRKVRPTQKFVAITDIVLRTACAMLDKLIQNIILKNPDKAMVCSQLVYQIYQDCGKEYNIEIEGGLFQTGENLSDDAGMICLADLATYAQEPEEEMNLASNFSVLSEEELAKELYLALSEQDEEGKNDLLLSVTDLGELPAWTKIFLEKLETFLEKSKSNLPINALFITPADLAYNSKNLETVGKLKIVRSK